MNLRHSLFLLAIAANVAGSSATNLRVPACTAYSDPDPEPAGMRFSQRSGIIAYGEKFTRPATEKHPLDLGE